MCFELVMKHMKPLGSRRQVGQDREGFDLAAF